MARVVSSNVMSLKTLRIATLVGFCSLLGMEGSAQYAWDFGVHIGGSNYLGEMGGTDQPRRDFVWDMKLSQTRFTFGTFARRKVNRLISINSGLMRVALCLEETIEQAMGTGPPNLERLQRVLPAIDTHLRVTRQVDRFAQIELRAAEARKPKPTDNSTSQVCLDTHSTIGISQSEDSEV